MNWNQTYELISARHSFKDFGQNNFANRSHDKHIVTCKELAWRIIVDSRFGDWIYCMSLLQLHLITIVHTLKLLLVLGLVSSLQSSTVQSNRVQLTLMLRTTVSRSVYLGIKHPSGAYNKIFIIVRQLWVCWCGAFSLTRGRVCLIQSLMLRPTGCRPVCLGIKHTSGAYDQIFISFRQLRVCWWEDGCRWELLLAFASTVILRSESHETHDHIVLSQIWDFPFRCSRG
jgi:hypothetical protein